MTPSQDSLVTKEEALERLTHFMEQPIDVDALIECFKWQGKLALWILQERNQGQPKPNQLLEQLSIAKTIPEIAKIVAQLLTTCGIYGYQAIGMELARISVTAGLGRN